MDGMIGFILAGFALTGSPGPATLSLAATGAAFGTRQGFLYMLGLAVGIVLVMLIIASGVEGVLLAVPGARPVVAVLSAAYFLYLAWRIATAAPLGSETVAQSPPSFFGGLLLQLINPKGYMAMAALFSGFVLMPQGLGLDVAMKVAVVTVIVVIVNLAWLVSGAMLTRFFRAPRSSRIINIGFAILLIASLAATLAL